MRTFIFVAAIVAVLSSWIVSPAQAAGKYVKQESLQKKKDAEKEPFDWEKVRPKKLSGNEKIDEYILRCDTIWMNVRTYRDSITFYRLDTFYCPQEKCMLVQLRDENGNKKNIGRTIVQSAHIFTVGTRLVLDAALVNTLAVSATTEMVSSPLLGLSHGKCLKAAPALTKIAIEEGKAMAAAKKEQTRQLKELHEGKQVGSTSTTYRLPYEGELPAGAEVIDNLDDFDFGESDEGDLSDEEVNAIIEQMN
jgi:hypothetical protein